MLRRRRFEDSNGAKRGVLREDRSQDKRGCVRVWRRVVNGCDAMQRAKEGTQKQYLGHTTRSQSQERTRRQRGCRAAQVVGCGNEVVTECE